MTIQMEVLSPSTAASSIAWRELRSGTWSTPSLPQAPDCSADIINVLVPSLGANWWTAIIFVRETDSEDCAYLISVDSADFESLDAAQAWVADWIPLHF